MEREIYLVVGTSGEAADLQSWNVASYIDQEAAEAHVEELHTAIGGEWIRPGNHMALNAELRASGLDPRSQIDYTGASYLAEAVPLRETPPKPPLGPRSRPSLLAERAGHDLAADLPSTR